MKSTFVSTVSHQLRAPLTSIYGFAETLLRRDVLFGEAERRDVPRLHRVRGAAADDDRRHAAQRREARGRRPPGGARADRPPGRSSRRRSRASRRAPTSTATASCSSCRTSRSPLPPTARSSARSSRTCSTTPSSSRRDGGTVTVEAHRRAGRVEVRVVDEGDGIPEAEREHIFSKFHRADSTGGHGGAGLGLFIARGLVLAMGGRIWVDSAEGGGSSFAFELPLAEATERGAGGV